MEDGAKVETVLMRYDYGNVICVSSEVGCSMGCAFCASGLLKKERGLTAAEMTGEVIVMNQLLGQRGRERLPHRRDGDGRAVSITTISLSFVHIMNEQRGSRSGPATSRSAPAGSSMGSNATPSEGIQINLAISLHAPNDEIRKKIMPIANRYTIKELLDAVRYYIDKGGRRVTFEYIMIKGVNDSLECAEELANKLRGILCYVNLIPYNPVKEKPFERSREFDHPRFQRKTQRFGHQLHRPQRIRHRYRCRLRAVACKIREEGSQ
jgi:23S rRNA (adenine2503-C2)-methyltransferase